MSSKVSSRLWLLTRIRSCLSLETSKKVYALLAQLVFDYADVACGEKSPKDVAKIYSAYKTVQLKLFLRWKTLKDTLSLSLLTG